MSEIYITNIFLLDKESKTALEENKLNQSNTANIEK